MASKLISFSGTRNEGMQEEKAYLGNKGWGLVQMCAMGLPVPPGFILSTDLFRQWQQGTLTLDGDLFQSIRQAMLELTQDRGGQLHFAEPAAPLLVSVRSGAAVSMPGMMETILNVGLNQEGVLHLASQTQNPLFAVDVYRRLIQTYSRALSPTLSDATAFETIGSQIKQQSHLSQHLDTNWLSEKIASLHDRFLEIHGVPFPQDPWEQLQTGILSVWKSWESQRAKAYRSRYQIPDKMGTAVIIQAMVFGNMNNRSATGVLFTRNPSDGRNQPYGEFLTRAQGEDVVAGSHTPLPIADMVDVFPSCYKQLMSFSSHLEQTLADMQDIEFTIENDKLWILQTRTGKRSAAAMVQIAVDLKEENILTTRTAIERIEPQRLHELSGPSWNPNASKKNVAQGLPACPGIAKGPIALSIDEVQKWRQQGVLPILVRTETSPDDVPAMQSSAGVLTKRGGMTSHAAVVARGMGICSIVGCSEMNIDLPNKRVTFGACSMKAGEWISIDGFTGEVFSGNLPTVDMPPSSSPAYTLLMQWASQVGSMQVRANADTPDDAKRARQQQAAGIGLCRTEHMFFQPDRLAWMQRMILADTETEQNKCLDVLESMQHEDFKSLLLEMNGLPTTIRLLDPPLHEFLPQTEDGIAKLALLSGQSTEKLAASARTLHEENPMLGLRGCRLGILKPNIYKMQVRALLRAAQTLQKQGTPTALEIMIPLVGDTEEFRFCRNQITLAAQEIEEELGKLPAFLVGTMIEIPRACLIADKLAPLCDFFSFGTNDLTQMTLGISRDDAHSFLPAYKKAGIYPTDPFMELDQTGVGELIKWAVAKARQGHPSIKLGVCGEHGGDPGSIAFFHELGMHYVSCSPNRIPVARIAVAQATLSAKREKQAD